MGNDFKHLQNGKQHTVKIFRFDTISTVLCRARPKYWTKTSLVAVSLSVLLSDFAHEAGGKQGKAAQMPNRAYGQEDPVSEPNYESKWWGYIYDQMMAEQQDL